MGTLRIAYSDAVGRDNASPIAVHEFTSSGITHTSVATSGTSASATLPATVRWVTLRPTVPMHVRIGIGAQTATTADFLLDAYEVWSFSVEPGASYTIAAIEP